MSSFVVYLHMIKPLPVRMTPLPHTFAMRKKSISCSKSILQTLTVHSSNITIRPRKSYNKTKETMHVSPFPIHLPYNQTTVLAFLSTIHLQHFLHQVYMFEAQITTHSILLVYCSHSAKPYTTDQQNNTLLLACHSSLHSIEKRERETTHD